MIELTDWLREELRRRALADAPEECCGLISRARPTDRYPEGRLHLYRAENAAESPTDSFLIAPRDQIAILKQIEAGREMLAGIYHSHPRSGLEPSQRDRQIARSWPGLTWVIIGRQECPCCVGGFVVDVEPECCGNATSSGECLGDCAVPKQVEKQCPSCENGFVPEFAFFCGLL